MAVTMGPQSAKTGHAIWRNFRRKKVVGSTFRFIADPKLPNPVVEWLRALPFPPEEIPKEGGILLHFRECGKVSYEPDGSMIVDESPLATLFLPRIRRGVLWTVGELHFLSRRTPERFPDLAKVSSAFSRWLNRLPCVYSNKISVNEFSYFLEGSVKNYHAPVYAFESGLDALRSGRYFVGDGDNEFVLDRLCQILRLRGTDCASS
jgi:hypothetical protein